MLVIRHLRKLELREINLPKASQLGSGEDSNQTQVCLTPTFLEPTYQSLTFLMHLVVSHSRAEPALLKTIRFHVNDNIFMAGKSALVWIINLPFCVTVGL